MESYKIKSVINKITRFASDYLPALTNHSLTY
jgi:hypothetical protein